MVSCLSVVFGSSVSCVYGFVMLKLCWLVMLCRLSRCCVSSLWLVVLNVFGE